MSAQEKTDPTKDLRNLIYEHIRDDADPIDPQFYIEAGRLIEQGADAKEGYGFLACRTFRQKCRPVFEFLADHCESINEPDPLERFCFLAEVSGIANPLPIQILLERGADVLRRGSKGELPIESAITHGVNAHPAANVLLAGMIVALKDTPQDLYECMFCYSNRSGEDRQKQKSYFHPKILEIFDFPANDPPPTLDTLLQVDPRTVSYKPGFQGLNLTAIIETLNLSLSEDQRNYVRPNESKPPHGHLTP